MMPDKIILIAHRDPIVRDRFSAALTEARHTCVTAATAETARAAAHDSDRPISLAVVEAGLGGEPLAWIQALRGAHTWPVLVFAGSVRSVTETRALLQASVAGYINEHATAALILPALAPHLFPANFDRRLGRRVVLGIPVSYRSGETIATAVTLNVSRGGLAIRTLSPLSPGVAVELKFSGRSKHAIEARGRVIWADRKVGMGIQFERVSPQDQQAIDRLTGAP